MLYTFTEGWISALYLIMLNYLENRSLDTPKDIGKLIENAVYIHFSEEKKELMLSLCIFESFSIEQAIHVSNNENAERLLAEVTARNAFVKYDSGSKTYQIHNIFMNFLQEELEKGELQKPLYQKAGQWFLKTGDYNLAQHYFYLCQDFDCIYLALEKEKPAAVNYTYKKDAFIKYFLECPGKVKEKYHFAMIIIHTYIYVAAANWRIFRQSEALASLRKALDLAMPDKLYIPFVENCDYIKDMLEKLDCDGSYREDIARIVALYAPYQKAIELIQKEHFSETKAKLSERELEIAHLAADGLTNKEIGEWLSISANTVKMALKSIYSKLSINNRLLLKQHLETLEI